MQTRVENTISYLSIEEIPCADGPFPQPSCKQKKVLNHGDKDYESLMWGSKKMRSNNEKGTLCIYEKFLSLFLIFAISKLS